MERIQIDIEGAEFAVALRQIHVWGLDRDVCWKTRELDFESDPADELIAATSVVHRIPLLTRDKVILRSKMETFAR